MSQQHSIRNQSCPNSTCSFHQKTLAGNVVAHGNRYPRFKCTACGKTWVPHRNEATYRLRSTDEKIRAVRELLTQGQSVRKIAQQLAVTPGTVQRWKKKIIF